MNVTTPALLFSSISLLLLAYTNRFFVLANLIRTLHASSSQAPDEKAMKQIPNLRLRVKLIKYMQSCGVLSFILCTVSMFFIFLERPVAGNVAFGASVLALLISLSFSLYEVVISTRALDIVLDDLEQ